MRFRASTARAFVVLASLAAAGCNSDRLTATPESALPVGELASAGEITSVKITYPTNQVAVGDSLKLTAVLRDAAGNLVTGVAVKWTTSRSDRATVSATGVVVGRDSGGVSIGLVTPVKTTYARIYVVPGTASAPTTTTQPEPEPAPEPSEPVVTTTATAGDVAVALRRFDGSTGTVLVSSGVPLRPGMLFPGQERQVRLFVGTTELPVSVRGLPSTHRDGSLRSILVQASYSVPSAGATGRLSIGTARATSMDRAAATPVAVPKAAVLPTDPAYLLATELVGPTISVAQAKAQGGEFDVYERDFVKYAEQHWANAGDAWGDNYYDRALIYYAAWVRTGNATYWNRAARIAYNYRTQYLEANGYGASPHWAQLEGLEKHYLLTGDERSRTAVGETADILYRGFQVSRDLADRSKSENRIRARVLQGNLLSWRLKAKVGRDGRSWATRLDEAIPKVLATQSSDGGFRFASTCWQTLNYMDGMLADVLIEVHRTYRADSRILPALRRLADYQWSTQWISASGAFKYISATCDGVGGPKAAVDLSGLMINAFAWVYDQTGDATYKTRADAIFAGTVGTTWLTGTKQFNQQYTTSYRYLQYRR